MTPRKSELQMERAKYEPVLPAVLTKGPAGAALRRGRNTESESDREALRQIFPRTYGLPLTAFARGRNPAAGKKSFRAAVVLSGGQAPGGHNVIAGLFDALKKANSKNKLYGYLGGPSGILEDKSLEITARLVDEYRNTGGFDMIQSGRTKIETPQQFAAAERGMRANRLDALVVVGGDDSNTNAALLAEHFKAGGLSTGVIGVPKTIDGDLKSALVEASFGFDTATKIYAEMAGNICRDVNSARKYWHFIRLMGRSASHIALEVAFKTRPNVALVGEEVLAKKMTLADVVDAVAAVVARRAAQGKNYGVALVPEGLIEFIPEVKALISALNDLLARDPAAASGGPEAVAAALPAGPAALLRSLPEGIQNQLALDRDPHGNVRVSQIETEKLLADMVEARLARMKAEGFYEGKFAVVTHFFGYEGRCGDPSNFDANYCYALGGNAAALALNGLTGCLSSVRRLVKPASQWECGGVPLTMMMNMERRHGKEKPVIRKALVELDGAPFRAFQKSRSAWAMEDDYAFPGPVQYFGPSSVTDMTTVTLRLERAGGR
ncbi:MAG: diphosphate--fructose-6-phosphate 1-phosphotransferase [Elusimicrobiota bacterium]